MKGVIGVGLASLAYCDQCGNPSKPVELILEGWHHRPRICATCLAQLLASAIKAEARGVGPL